MDVLYGLAKDFVFKDAVAFLKGKKALTSEEYRLLDDESRAKAFTVSGYTTGYKNHRGETPERSQSSSRCIGCPD